MFYNPDRLEYLYSLDKEHTKSLYSRGIPVFFHKHKSHYLQSSPKEFIRFVCECIVNMLEGNLKSKERQHVANFQSDVCLFYLSFSRKNNLKAKKRRSSFWKWFSSNKSPLYLGEAMLMGTRILVQFFTPKYSNICICTWCWWRVRTHSGKGPGYCCKIGRGPNSCMLGHVSGHVFRLYVNVLLASIVNSVDFWSSIICIVLDIELGDKNVNSELGVKLMGMSRGSHFVLRKTTNARSRNFVVPKICTDFCGTTELWIELEWAPKRSTTEFTRKIEYKRFD